MKNDNKSKNKKLKKEVSTKNSENLDVKKPLEHNGSDIDLKKTDINNDYKEQENSVNEQNNHIDTGITDNASESKIGIGWTISIILTTIFGLVITIYLTIHHYRMMSGLPEYQSFCSVSEVIDCDMVNSSSYSEFKGLPLALFGAAIYASILCLMILSIFIKGLVVKRYMVFISLIGLLSFCFSLYLAYVSAFILEAVCILCVITYFINLYMFLGASFAAFGTEWFFKPFRSYLGPFGFKFKSFLERYSVSRPKSAIGNAAGIFIIIMVVIQGFFAAIYLDAKYLGFTEKDINAFMEKYKAINKMEVNIKDAPFWGTDNPELTIVVFEDFLCTFCKRAHVTAFPIFKEFKNKIKVVYKHLPYDKDCHPSLKRTLHPGACKSAIAASCASFQGREKFLTFQEYFFKHQEEIKPDMEISKTAELIGGVDMEKFNECLELGRGELVVRNDFADAVDLKITRTPAYFFNGRKWEGALKPIFIKKILEFELKRKE